MTLPIYHAMSGLLKRKGRADVTPGTEFTLRVTKPTVDNTGVRAGTVLTTVAGDLTVTTAGSVITGKRIEGRLIIQAANVTVRDCEIVGAASLASTGSYFLIDTQSAAATNALVEFCTVNPRAVNEATDGFRGGNVTIRRCQILNTVDQFGISGPGVVLEGNYADKMAYLSPCSYQGDNQTHNDAVQFHPGNSGAQLIGNNLVAKYGTAGTHSPGTWNHKGGTTPAGASNVSCAVLMFGSNLGSGLTMNAVVEDNWLGGGLQPVNASGAAGSNIGRLYRNRFDGDSYQPGSGEVWTIVKGGSTIDTGSGANVNVYESTGLPVQVRS